MITEAIHATKELVKAVPLLGGSHSQSDYKAALELVNYLIDKDDENPLIDILSIKISEYEENSEQFCEFNKALEAMPTGVAVLRVLMDQYHLKQTDLKNEIGSKSLVSQILNGKRSLTIAHIRALSARFNVRCELFI
ncbi:helix-turn-helix domain-containing protein [Candidatus Williamhamiltonella defendens]|uniref:Transcriptional regulator n=1 Tax=Candidatus Hamiltonella defensa (Bemisia tabaci) TaxID=672795 RepID=A0A249DZH5_9ENTR|nr:helix-turn-helix domain-containing protein [Candidatus Hamiltonella defensa]ASX26953.1 transcriptional regulator [Candidatus Hamiltonella defensa (Bemisia tabaci)]CED79584.1 Problable Antitoxin HigA [Candidatus Hamiltonella defensa (Bemisia tabaci)]